MVVQFARWGNSLAVRIPASIAKEIGAADGASVDLFVEDGTLVLRPKKKRYSARELIAAINSENIHSETLIGEAVGKEILDEYKDPHSGCR